jgi:hypothetical protein
MYIEELGSLQYYIVLLGKTRLGSDQPDYETMRSFVNQVLDGHILHYWEVESMMSLKSLASKKPSADRLLEIADNILDKYASEKGLLNPSNTSIWEKDKTLRNIILLNRDLLLFRELCLSISSGDFGRVEILMGNLVMMFAGAGCKNYVTEMLYFIQNLRKVWTPEFA